MQGAEGVAPRRLDGWKAIASYFKRDRSTVMRWARDRDLPVRRLPGGKQGSVFALEHELAAWALHNSDADEALSRDEAPPAPAFAPLPRPKPTRWWIPAVFASALLALFAGLLLIRDPAPLARPVPGSVALPGDPQAAADFVAARDRWARRTEPDLNEAIRLLQRVTAKVPDFAPAYAALADAWLLRREYGQTDARDPFGPARQAAERAVQLDPDLPAAQRAIGFIAYWGDNQKERGMAAFRRAIALDDHDGQTHFWFANVLADAGYDAEAQTEYARARLLLPGSAAIEIEHAYSHWLAGRDRRALAELRALIPRYPTDPNLHLCLSWVYIGMGDLGGFVRENALVARFRNDPAQLREAAALTAAHARDPKEALALLIGQRRHAAETDSSTTRQSPAFFAASLGDREAALALMAEADAAREHWYGDSIRRRIAARWPDDAAVHQLLARLYSGDAGAS